MLSVLGAIYQLLSSFEGINSYLWYGMVRYGTVRYGTVWYGMAWYGMGYCIVIVFNKYKTFSVLIYSYINTSGNWKNEKLSIS